jgi:hypothetical protein
MRSPPLSSGGARVGWGQPMPTVFGSFDKLMEAFAAAAVDPARWDAAMDVASDATGSLGAPGAATRALAKSPEERIDERRGGGLCRRGLDSPRRTVSIHPDDSSP